MLLNQVILVEVPKAPPRDRRLVVVGLTRILTQSRLMTQPPLVEAWFVHFLSFHLAISNNVNSFDTGQSLSKPSSNSSLTHNFSRSPPKTYRKKRTWL
jgi:hypothetical protein